MNSRGWGKGENRIRKEAKEEIIEVKRRENMDKTKWRKQAKNERRYGWMNEEREREQQQEGGIRGS